MELRRGGRVPTGVARDWVVVLYILHGRGVHVPRAQNGAEGQLPFALFPGSLNFRPSPGCPDRPFRPFATRGCTLYDAEVNNAPLPDGLGVGKVERSPVPDRGFEGPYLRVNGELPPGLGPEQRFDVIFPRGGGLNDAGLTFLWGVSFAFSTQFSRGNFGLDSMKHRHLGFK